MLGKNKSLKQFEVSACGLFVTSQVSLLYIKGLFRKDFPCIALYINYTCITFKNTGFESLEQSLSHKMNA